MTTLTRTSQIRAAIRELLSDPTDERIVAVAFVGADALSFLTNPSGVAVYCWPQPGGTNPVGIERLVEAGAKVRFVDRLHTKIYWSRAKGTIIGSANLTTNALGDGGLREAVVSLPCGAFAMKPFIKSLQVASDFEGTLRWLHSAHVAFMQRNPPRGSVREERLVAPSFHAWISAGDGRADWRIGWFTEDARAPRDAVDVLERETGSRNYSTYLAVARAGDLKAGVFTLSFKVRDTADGNVRVSSFEWWAPGIATHSRHKDFKDYPHLWFPRGQRIPYGTQPPFDHRDSRFRRALAGAIRESGGTAWLFQASLKPSKTFLGILERQYSQAEE
jgi:hypothetical protein